MGIETYMEFTPNNLLILANIILIFIAFLLLIGLRKSKKKPETSVAIQPKKEKISELSGISDIKPEEFKSQKFDLKKDVLSAPTPPETVSRQGIESLSTAMKALVEPLLKPEDVEVTKAEGEISEVHDNSMLKHTDKLEEVESKVLEIDEFELEDELPEMFESPSELEIPPPVKEEEKIAEKPVEAPSITPEPEVKPHVKEKEIPPQELTLPLELSTMTEKVVEKTAEVVEVPPEPEKPSVVTAVDKLVEAFTKPPEPEITKTAVEEEKVAEAPSTTNEPEFKVFKFDMEEEKKPEVVEAPTEPEFKLFKFEKEPEAVTAPPEVKLFPFDKEEKKPEAIAAPPEVKLFPLDMEEKKPEVIAVPASPDVLTAETTEKPATAAVTESPPGEPSVPEHGEKKAKRKSLF